jgi:hypothetical protein
MILRENSTADTRQKVLAVLDRPKAAGQRYTKM